MEQAILPRLADELRGIADRLRVGRPRTAPSRRSDPRRLDLARQRARRLYIDGYLQLDELERELDRLNRAAEGSAPAPPARSTPTTQQVQEVAAALEKHWLAWSVESKRELLQNVVECIIPNYEDLAGSEIVWRWDV